MKISLTRQSTGVAVYISEQKYYYSATVKKFKNVFSGAWHPSEIDATAIGLHSTVNGAKTYCDVIARAIAVAEKLDANPETVKEEEL